MGGVVVLVTLAVSVPETTAEPLPEPRAPAVMDSPKLLAGSAVKVTGVASALAAVNKKLAAAATNPFLKMPMLGPPGCSPFGRHDLCPTGRRRCVAGAGIRSICAVGHSGLPRLRQTRPRSGACPLEAPAGE